MGGAGGAGTPVGGGGGPGMVGGGGKTGGIKTPAEVSN